jgi:two-component system, NarL family, nitrate/nitrite response regulator NarL
MEQTGDGRGATDPRGRITALVADGHAPTRLGLKATLEACDDMEVCAEAHDANDAIELAGLHQPTLCLLDVDMPGDGIRAARRISLEASSSTIVMLSASEDDETLFAALRAGAAGYLLKDMDVARIPETLRGALRGELALSRRLATRVVDEFRRGGTRRITLANGRTVVLTAREWLIVGQLLHGATTTTIAAEQHVSPVTVRRHISEVMRKLRAPDREVALRLLRDGLAG